MRRVKKESKKVGGDKRAKRRERERERGRREKGRQRRRRENGARKEVNRPGGPRGPAAQRGWRLCAGGVTCHRATGQITRAVLAHLQWMEQLRKVLGESDGLWSTDWFMRGNQNPPLFRPEEVLNLYPHNQASHGFLSSARFLHAEACPIRRACIA